MRAAWTHAVTSSPMQSHAGSMRRLVEACSSPSAHAPPCARAQRPPPARRPWCRPPPAPGPCARCHRPAARSRSQSTWASVGCEAVAGTGQARHERCRRCARRSATQTRLRSIAAILRAPRRTLTDSTTTSGPLTPPMVRYSGGGTAGSARISSGEQRGFLQRAGGAARASASDAPRAPAQRSGPWAAPAGASGSF